MDDTLLVEHITDLVAEEVFIRHHLTLAASCNVDDISEYENISARFPKLFKRGKKKKVPKKPRKKRKKKGSGKRGGGRGGKSKKGKKKKSGKSEGKQKKPKPQGAFTQNTFSTTTTTIDSEVDIGKKNKSKSGAPGSPPLQPRRKRVLGKVKGLLKRRPKTEAQVKEREVRKRIRKEVKGKKAAVRQQAKQTKAATRQQTKQTKATARQQAKQTKADERARAKAAKEAARAQSGAKPPLVTRLRTGVARGVKRAAEAVKRAKQRITPGRSTTTTTVTIQPYEQGVPPSYQPPGPQQPQQYPQYPQVYPQPYPAPQTQPSPQVVFIPSQPQPLPPPRSQIFVVPQAPVQPSSQQPEIVFVPPGSPSQAAIPSARMPKMLDLTNPQMNVNVEKFHGELKGFDLAGAPYRIRGDHYIYKIAPPVGLAKPTVMAGETLYYGFRYNRSLVLDRTHPGWWILLPSSTLTISDELPSSSEEEGSEESGESEEGSDEELGDEFLATDSEEESESEREVIEGTFEFSIDQRDPTTGLTPYETWREIRGNVRAIVSDVFGLD